SHEIPPNPLASQYTPLPTVYGDCVGIASQPSSHITEGQPQSYPFHYLPPMIIQLGGYGYGFESHWPYFLIIGIHITRIVANKAKEQYRIRIPIREVPKVQQLRVLGRCSLSPALLMASISSARPSPGAGPQRGHLPRPRAVAYLAPLAQSDRASVFETALACDRRGPPPTDQKTYSLVGLGLSPQNTTPGTPGALGLGGNPRAAHCYMFQSTAINETMVEPSVFYANTVNFPYNLFDFFLRSYKPHWEARVHISDLRLTYDPGGKMAACFARGVTFMKTKPKRLENSSEGSLRDSSTEG
ncbi:3410_t:CDS:2, partial [Funneliformis geosporum]